MKVYDLDGKQSVLTVAGYEVDGSQKRPRSDLHLTARTLLKSQFPLYAITEEIPITLKRGTVVYVDFLIPQLKICIEVNGRQHFEFVSHFHGDLAGFRLQQKNDRLKREWADLNNFKLIDFNYNETEDEWKTKLLNRR